jgi:hypothetical protein
MNDESDGSQERNLKELFLNEAFVLGALQTASAASVLGVINQISNLRKLLAFAEESILIAITCFVLSLTMAIVGSAFRYQHIKSRIDADRATNSGRGAAKRYGAADYVAKLSATASHRLIIASTGAMLLGFVTLLASMWFRYLGY